MVFPFEVTVVEARGGEGEMGRGGDEKREEHSRAGCPPSPPLLVSLSMCYDAAVISPTTGPAIFPSCALFADPADAVGSPTSCTTMSKRSVPRMTTSSCSNAFRACSDIWMVVCRRSPNRAAIARLPNRQQTWLVAGLLGMT